MADIEGRISSYSYFVGTEELDMKPKPRDILRFDGTVTKRRINNFWHGSIIEQSTTLLETSIFISCESFFENNQDFLSILLSDPRCSCYFIPERFDQIAQMIVSQVELLMEFPSETDECADLECQEFALTLGIFVDVVEDGEVENAIIEEFMQQDVSMMIPASDEAIHSLETFTDNHSLFLEIVKCNICMENFHAEENEDVKLSSSMPCGHVFHYHCIVRWLKNSHTCPLCRYPMPTVKD